MRNISAETIKNIGILAHVDAGKTTLTEQILFTTGAIRKIGSVDSGTAQTDWLPIERDRGISIKSARASFIRGNLQINLIDTPGHADFAGEVERCLTALDGVIFVLSAVEGVQSHSENLWRAIENLELPAVVFINKIDRAGSRCAELTAELPETLPCKEARRFFSLNLPVNEGGADCAVKTDSSLSEKMADAASEFDNLLTEEFIIKGSLSEERISNSFAGCVFRKEIVPVLYGSAKLGIGVNELLDAVYNYLPDASRKETDHLSAYVYKIEHDAQMGKVAHVRMFGGELSARDLVTPYKEPENSDSSEKRIADAGDKITQIRKYNGAKFQDTGKIIAGDTAALCGLRSFKAGDVIGKTEFIRHRLANPFLSVRVMPKTPEQLTPLITAISELTDEEPLFNYKWEKTEREITINIIGEIQLEVLSSLLRERYNLTADFSPPSVIYKETPAKAGYGYEAYTMPKPCWAVVKFYIEPLPRGSGVIYNEGQVPHNKLFYKYQKHIQRSFMESLEQGLYGWEVCDLRATLADGEHHTIHTHPLDFFVATPMALMNGLYNTGTIILEPWLLVRINADETLSGRIMNDIIAMRGKFDTPVTQKSNVTVEAELPAATSLGYPIKLASMSGGKATWSVRFNGYRDCLPQFAQSTPRRGINPLDRAKWILQARGAL